MVGIQKNLSNMTKEIIKMFTTLAIIVNISCAISALITKESQPWWLYAIECLIMACLFYTNVYRS